MDKHKIVDRIRKLLALAGNAGTEHEAANAAEQAARLMETYEIEEAELRVLESARRNDPIERAFAVPGGEAKKRVAWKSSIAWAVARRFGCRQYWRGASIRLFGRQSAVQAASYTCQYLWTEVDRLAAVAVRAADVEAADYYCNGRWTEKPATRAWKNSFRLGAAATIARRLAEMTRATVTVADVEIDAKDMPVAESLPEAPSSQALVLIDRDRVEVDNVYKSYSANFTMMSSIGSTSGSGYGAGARAGERVSLGGAVASLPAGPGRLGGVK